MTIFWIVVLLQSICFTAACWPNSYDWNSWSSCSRPCGGGTRHRTEYSCVLNHKGDTQTEGCNEHCYNGYAFWGGRCQCSTWRSGRCCETCEQTNIPHCKSGRSRCGGNPDNIMCTDCKDPYYSGGYGKGCKECPAIEYCQDRHCTTPANTKCLHCTGDNYFFKRTISDTKCERLCAWNNHFCWPGICGADGFTKNCQCSSGFRLVSNRRETSCQPVKQPGIETCLTTFVGSNGEKKQSTSGNSSRACMNLKDVYGNYQVKRILYDFLSELTISVPNIPKPLFINESNFGVTDSSIYLKKKLVSGVESELKVINLLKDLSNGTLASQIYSSNGSILTSTSEFDLMDGERLCVYYESLGGGFLSSIDVRTHDNLGAVPYQKTSKRKHICYRYDHSPPEHCKASKKCTDKDPLIIRNRVTKSNQVFLSFAGWLDPLPFPGDTELASSIESFEISVHKTDSSAGIVQIDSSSIFNKKVAAPVSSMVLYLNTSSPNLFCIVLEVKDVADNIRQCRRFVLFDDSSYIRIRNDKPLVVYSAARDTSYTWQTHHNAVCLGWEDHFYNKHYLDNPVLNPIEADSNGLISGIYDQIDGVLPVNGTENVHGIVEFRLYWSLDNNAFSSPQKVPNIKNQRFCQNFNLRDGQTYRLKIQAIDISNNSLEDITLVKIDRSVPHVKNLWLQKNEHKVLFVHDNKDLTKMDLYFEALDPHSGILNVEWAFGTSDSFRDLLTGILKPTVLKENTCTNTSNPCYCPDIGKCEEYSYKVPLNKLKEIDRDNGNHNRNYYFTIKATNNALLFNVEHVQILVDHSPPETGVIQEGPFGSLDIDYTSEESVLVNWHGFIDHESGIRLYRVYLAFKCLNKEDLVKGNRTNDILEYAEVPYTVKSVEFRLNRTEKYFFSMLAMNNAMNPSEIICSDGITKVTTKPTIHNLTLRHASWSDAITCLYGKSWLLLSSMYRIQVDSVEPCVQRCRNISSESNLIVALSEVMSSKTDQDMSSFLCKKLPLYNGQNIIYLPNDDIFIRWDKDKDDSQIQDYSVGFGREVSEQNTPSIISYISTNRKTFFNHKHEGFGSDSIFYIFLKALSKSGLSRIIPIGPIIVDVTAPIQRKDIDVAITKENIEVSWENDTFYDPEQQSDITKITIRFVTDDGPVSPLHEWNLDNLEDSGTCFRFPLQRLQEQDNDLGLLFYAKLFVYNNAGHFLEVLSKGFRLPSRYSPGQAILYDLDPVNRIKGIIEDVEYHFTSNVLCVAWKGFKHHENISLEIGVGQDRWHDDIVNFYSTQNTEIECINSSSIITGRTYFMLLRAKCSGGETFVTSNGVKILDVSRVIESLKVKLGQPQNTTKPLTKFKSVNTRLLNNITFDVPLRVGRKHCFGVKDNANEIIDVNDIEIKSNDVHIDFTSNEMLGNLILVFSFTENPKFSVNITKENISSFTISVFNCHGDTKVISMGEDVKISWYFTQNIQEAFSYEIRLLRIENKRNTSNVFQYPRRLFGTSNITKTATFKNSFTGGDTLQAEVMLYTNDHLVGVVHSNNFTVLNGIFDGQVGNTSVEYNAARKCLDFQATWKSFHMESWMMSHYMWALSKDDSGTKLLTKWSLVVENGNTTYQVKRCLSVPFYVGTTMFMCVRGYSLAGSSGLRCSKITHLNVSSFPVDVVYEFDTNTDMWNDIRQMIHSNWIGEKIRIIHDNELNFGTVESLVGAAIMYATDRNVTWFLMKSPSTPKSCKHDDRCLVKITTDTGFVVFPQDKIVLNERLYVCIHATDQVVQREFYNETFMEIVSCSNGFIIDSQPPNKGRISVENHNGFLTSRNVEISWSGFADNVNAIDFGYPSNLSYYTVAIGSLPGSDDVVATNSTSSMFMDAALEVDDGSTLYISVTAFDMSRQNVSVVKVVHLDTSPPMNGHLLFGNSMLDQLHITSYSVDLHLRDFKDVHSGIDYFEVGVGRTEHIDDVVTMEVCPTDDAQLILSRDKMIEGHVYFILVTATNKAGLTSEITSMPLIIDTTPPSPGHVLDGSLDVKKDVDFQIDHQVISGHWYGFVDQQSGIDYYMVCLGTRPYVDDVKSFVNVGLSQDISWIGTFTIGEKYYITVSACNAAGLCSRVSSDGIVLDNSPPVAGLVRVGWSSAHERYQPHNTSVRIHWEGFEDPHSSIERFEACVGTIQFSCDILPMFPCLLQSSIIKSGIKIPLRTEMYATVIAYNNARLNITQTSDIFLVDNTPPNVVTNPTFLLDYNANAGKQIQWERSVLRVLWGFKDEDSPILRHELSLLTHHEGHTPIEHMQLGNVNNITITLDGDNWLHNGDTYSVVITSCNAAGHCTSAFTPDLLIDSTPPILGGFKPPMTWENFVSFSGELQSQLMLTWYGFEDGESEIETYYISVGKTYSGHELSVDIIPVVAKNTLSEMNANVTLNTPLNADNLLILSIWAQNKAGLNSTIGRISVNTLLTDNYANTSIQSGILEIQKHSCDVQFCNKDCTCAVVGQPCTDSGHIKPCQTPVTDSNKTLTEFPKINVTGGLLNFDQNITASSACLSGHWDIVQDNTTREIVRYEWSAGLLGQPVGEGIFDLKSEIPWNDVGLHTSFVYCLPTNHSLIHAEKYSIYLRAWFDFDLFQEINSYPIVVDHSGPSVRRGKIVKDSDSSCSKDYDFINWTDTITACWDGVFYDQQGEIIHYSVSLGTSPKSDDVFPTTNVGFSTNYSHSQASLTHGTRYYFTVSAHNNIGVYTSIVSDGFTIDTDIPTPGVVFNTLYHRNEPYQSSNESFTMSWHGFVDYFSGIKSYLVSLIESDVTDSSNMTFLNIGLKTRHTFSNISIASGVSYVGVVKAIDGAGHTSISVRSPSKNVDTSPPSGFVCTKYETVQEVDKHDMSEQRVQNLTLSVNLTKDALYVITSDVRGNNTHLKATLSIDKFTLRLPITTNHDGLLQMKYSFFSPLSGTQDVTIMLESNSFLNTTASMARCTDIIPDPNRALHAQQIGPNIIAVNVISQDRESGIRKVDIGAGSTYGGFQFQPLTSIHGGNNGILYINAPHGSPIHVTAIVENYADLKTVFYSQPITMDHTRPHIENVTATQHSANTLTVIRSTWVVKDLESGVKACYCRIGGSRFSSDIVEPWKVDTLTSCTSPELKLRNGMEVYITIKCINNVELLYEACSEPVPIVNHPPLTDQAKLKFVKLNRESNDDVVVVSETTYIQTNDSHIQMQWSGFLDISPIEEYKYRLLQNNLPILDWTSSGRKSMATITGYPLNSGSTYTAEVKALNAMQWSSAIRSSLLIYNTQPKLTGSAASITKSDRKLTLDWARVFDQNLPSGLSMVYSVAIGSRPGFNDITDVQHRKTPSLEIFVPVSTIVSPAVKEIFITITSHFNTGMSTRYQTNFKF